jgi:hypothetical protein
LPACPCHRLPHHPCSQRGLDRPQPYSCR